MTKEKMRLDSAEMVAAKKEFVLEMTESIARDVQEFVEKRLNTDGMGEHDAIRQSMQLESGIIHRIRRELGRNF